MPVTLILRSSLPIIHLWRPCATTKQLAATPSWTSMVCDWNILYRRYCLDKFLSRYFELIIMPENVVQQIPVKKKIAYPSYLNHYLMTLSKVLHLFIIVHWENLRVCDSLPLEQFSLHGCFSIIFNFSKK